MKLKIKLLSLILFISNFIFAQNTVKMTSNYGSENQEIQDLIDFENIFIEKLNFESENLKGKSFKINIEEYKNGKFRFVLRTTSAMCHLGDFLVISGRGGHVLPTPH